MTEELCRAKFELYCLDAGLNPAKDDDGDYSDFQTDTAWFAYQAAWNTRAEMEKSDA